MAKIVISLWDKPGGKVGIDVQPHPANLIKLAKGRPQDMTAAEAYAIRAFNAVKSASDEMAKGGGKMSIVVPKGRPGLF